MCVCVICACLDSVPFRYAPNVESRASRASPPSLSCRCGVVIVILPYPTLAGRCVGSRQSVRPSVWPVRHVQCVVGPGSWHRIVSGTPHNSAYVRVRPALHYIANVHRTKVRAPALVCEWLKRCVCSRMCVRVCTRVCLTRSAQVQHRQHRQT